MRLKFFSLLFSSSLVTGCITSQEGASFQEFDDMSIYSDDGERGLVFVKQSNGPEKFCFGPQPDSISTVSGGFSASIPSINGKESAGETRSMGATSLGGRSASVLLAREFLYRACEFSANYNLDKTEAESFFLKIVDSLTVILPSQTELGVDGISSTGSTESTESTESEEGS